MEDWKGPATLVGITAGVVLVWEIEHEDRLKREAFAKALSFIKPWGKGIVNFGATGTWTNGYTDEIARHPAVKINVDIRQDDIPNFLYWNLQNTPYPFEDKEFDVAFASHILEHLGNWKEVLGEWVRIADKVIIALPVPYLFGWFLPTHKQHFTYEDIENIKRENPSIEIYC